MSGQLVCWYSKDGGPWKRIELGSRSIVAWNLGQMPPGDIYDDGYGNRYQSYEMADPR